MLIILSLLINTYFDQACFYKQLIGSADES